MTVQFLSVNQQGFETGTTGWIQMTNSTIAQSAAQAHSGTNSLAVTSSAGGSMSAGTTPQTGFVIMPGRTFLWSAWVRAAVSPRVTNMKLSYYQSDGVTASAIRAADIITTATDSTSVWTQVSTGNLVAPLDAFYAVPSVLFIATGAGAEVHYIDDASFTDVNAPFFKHGKAAELWFNGVDISPYFNSAEFALQVETAPVDGFKNTYHAFIPGQIMASLNAAGYYDSADADQVRDTLVATSTLDQLTYMPAGATAIGDFARLLNVNATDYKVGSPIGGAVSMDWTAQATAPVGIGEVLHTLASENAGTITGTGSPLLRGISTTTGAVLHVHATVLPAGATLDVKLQDSTALNGAYADITSGAIVQMTAVGSQRIVIPGTIRAYVQAVSVVAVHPVTFGVAAART